MEKINLTFLGTSNAIPTASRNHSSILISYKSENILIDCGEGTQRQFRQANLSPTKITKILITHWHGDHILGLPGLFQTLAMSNYNNVLHLYGPKGTKKALKIIDKITRIKIKLNTHEVKNKVVETKDFIITAAPMEHQTPTLAYSLKIKDKLKLNKQMLKKLKLPNSPLLKNLQQGKSIIFEGKRISPKQVASIQKGKKVTIILDTKLNQNAIKLANNSDLIITESTFTSSEESRASEYMHLTAKQAATIAKKSNSKKLILTHISQRYEHNLKSILKEAKSIFKNTTIVKDLDTIVL